MENTIHWLLLPYRKTPKVIAKQMNEITQKIIIGKILDGIEKDYPNILEWYNQKVLPGLETGEREIILACKIYKFYKNNKIPIEILGYVILKKTPSEKKICTFRVEEKYQRLGIGKRLMEASFEFLETRKPMITITEDNVKFFEPLLKRYKFKLVEKIKDLYVKGKTEYIYNKKWEKD